MPPAVPPTVRASFKGDVARVTLDNPPVNATSTAVRAGLLQAVAQVRGYRLAVLDCAGRTFVAGGDMSEFDAPPAPPHLPDVVDSIEKSKTPFLALLHGTVLGGGFEIAMACAYRLALPGTRFGLPEVNMGLIPGAGGTQRAPRLLGWPLAVDLACLGKVVSADALLETGAIDAISADPESLIRDWPPEPVRPVSQRTPPPLADEARAELTEFVAASAKGRLAPGLALEALFWAQEPFATGQPKERARHLDLRQSEQSRALRHVFFAERTAAKPGIIADVTPLQIRTIAVVGGGLMGAGIAAACLNAGYHVTLIEQDKSAADAARDRVDGLLQAGVARGKISRDQHAARRDALTTTDSYADAAEADIAIEAVFEDLAAKRAVFQTLAGMLRPDALLATNTSYLNPDEIFREVANPDRCLGLHFFSPAHIMKLVEIVKAGHTSPETLATGFSLARSMGKLPVLSGICDGFIGNRILSAYRRAAEYILADGALPHEIDAAMRAFGMAMGPFEAQDLSGLQIAHANRRRQDATRPASERYIPILDQLCEMGRLGRRSGAGWYTYSDGGSALPDPAVEALVLDYAKRAGITRQPVTPSDIQTRLLAAMANEGAKIVAEGIAESASAVDVVKTAGYGFPRWRGGPMYWAQSAGTEAVSRALGALETASPNSWIRAEIFKDERMAVI